MGSRMTGFVTGGPNGVRLYRFPRGFRMPISDNLVRMTSTQSTMTSRELHENRIATAMSKLITKLHSESPAGTMLVEMCWQAASGKMCTGGRLATSVGSCHSSRNGWMSSWMEKTTQNRSVFISLASAEDFFSLYGSRLRKPFL